MIKNLAFVLLFLSIGFTAHSQAVKAPKSKSESEIKANYQPGDEYKASTYDTKEKVASLELRIEKMKSNIEANKDNPKYNMAEIKEIVAKLEKTYAQIDSKLKSVKTSK
jgi:septal ring factor EnvC (AmiA/AmiB activator)